MQNKIEGQEIKKCAIKEYPYPTFLYTALLVPKCCPVHRNIKEYSLIFPGPVVSLVRPQLPHLKMGK